MSIWASGNVCGADDDDRFDGSVVSYIEGWSNHYPGQFIDPKTGCIYRFSRDVTEETPASIGTGWIPPYCVPGHPDDTSRDIDTTVGPWLRLDVTTRRVSIWAGLEIGNQDVISVCLDESAVRALRDHLTTWLERDKAYPQQAATELKAARADAEASRELRVKSERKVDSLHPPGRCGDQDCGGDW
ncbi:hypothetical protein [Mycobacterium canetti]|uniref:hypothetical protein n=1 Tax=Mycobacterium canetti TaxID=78331 RepID=UPI0003472C9F|nr:hypothetical protein [Mycobacterium canetti]